MARTNATWTKGTENAVTAAIDKSDSESLPREGGLQAMAGCILS